MKPIEISDTLTINPNNVLSYEKLNGGGCQIALSDSTTIVSKYQYADVLALIRAQTQKENKKILNNKAKAVKINTTKKEKINTERPKDTSVVTGEGVKDNKSSLFSFISKEKLSK